MGFFDFFKSDLNTLPSNSEVKPSEIKNDKLMGYDEFVGCNIPLIEVTFGFDYVTRKLTKECIERAYTKCDVYGLKLSKEYIIDIIKIPNIDWEIFELFDLDSYFNVYYYFRNRLRRNPEKFTMDAHLIISGVIGDQRKNQEIVDRHKQFIKLFDDYEIQKILVGKCGRFIEVLPNPSLELQLLAIKQDPNVIKKIKNPLPKFVDIAFSLNPDLIDLIENPTDDQIKTALINNVYSYNTNNISIDLIRDVIINKNETIIHFMSHPNHYNEPIINDLILKIFYENINLQKRILDKLIDNVLSLSNNASRNETQESALEKNKSILSDEEFQIYCIENKITTHEKFDKLGLLSEKIQLQLVELDINNYTTLYNPTKKVREYVNSKI